MPDLVLWIILALLVVFLVHSGFRLRRRIAGIREPEELMIAVARDAGITAGLAVLASLLVLMIEYAMRTGASEILLGLLMNWVYLAVLWIAVPVALVWSVIGGLVWLRLRREAKTSTKAA